MITEAVSGRTILRYRGEPVPHSVMFYGSFAGDGAVTAWCGCGWHTTLDGGHTAPELTRLARQHAGIEDSPEGDTP